MVAAIKIGPITYRVLEAERLDAERSGVCVGEIQYSTATIYVVPNLDPQFAPVNLLHEAIHGVLAHAGVDPATHDERVVEALAYGLVQVLRDNPELVKAITQRRTTGEEN